MSIEKHNGSVYFKKKKKQENDHIRGESGNEESNVFVLKGPQQNN